MAERAFDLVALLPMKAHSQRVPGKNFREIAGKPLVRWVLDVLLSITEIERVIINTDARRQLREVGVTPSERVVIRDRPEALRGDFVSMNRVLADDVESVNADRYLMTHTTNPLLRAPSIRAALTAFESSDSDSLFSVSRVQTRFYREDGTPVNHDPTNLVRTQDLEPWFEENSCLYLFSRSSFRSTGARIGKKPLMVQTPRLESIDIDGPDDWTLAEALLSRR